MAINKISMKSINRKKVFETLWQYGECTQSDISKLTNLTVASVGKIINEFEKKKLVCRSGYVVSNGGRKPIKYDVDKSYYYILGVSIGVGKIIFVISDLGGEISYQETQLFELNENPEIVLADIAHKLIEIINKNQISNDQLLGIGVSAPGPLDSMKGIVLNPPNLITWQNISVTRFLSDYFSQNIYLEKDANCMALSELFYGPAKNVSNLLYLMVDSGIGSGIVINGQIYRGTSQVAGEIGHATIDINGPKCNCGNYGCLEAVASGNAMIEKALIEIKNDSISILTAFEDNLTLNDILYGFLQSDALCSQLLFDSSRYAGIKLADKINFLNPELVVIGGTVPNKVHEYVTWVKDVAFKRIFQETAKSVRVRSSTFGEISEALGAATLVVSNIFQAKQLKDN
ncbi:ROK family protein [Alteribacillus sp. HJP-4]|uniref:ROK family transcriptional regulator n=1 Tax=Alteribacillus sp. HJP-4 TaxID=2775394 RepID=UPI0035CCC9EF